MSKELEIIFKNNKLTPWGITLKFFTPSDKIPLDSPMEFKIFFSKCFLLENYAFARSLYEHIKKFREIREDHSWYEKTRTVQKVEMRNHAFSVYVHALKVAKESVTNLALRRRYLKLYRKAITRGKTAKALYPKIKPSLGLMEDLNLINRRNANNNEVSLFEKNGHKPYYEIMKTFPDYKTIVAEENRIPILLEAFGYSGKKMLSDREIILNIENLYKQLADPVFKACDINALIDITVIQKGLQGYELKESNVKEIIIEASKKNMYKYQILPDRYGRRRFLKVRS